MLPGTGISKSASSAQEDGSSMLTMSVCPSLTNAESMLPMETAPLATRDMTSSTDSASSQNPTMPNPPTSDVVSGTGMLKSA